MGRVPTPRGVPWALANWPMRSLLLSLAHGHTADQQWANPPFTRSTSRITACLGSRLRPVSRTLAILQSLIFEPRYFYARSSTARLRVFRKSYKVLALESTAESALASTGRQSPNKQGRSAELSICQNLRVNVVAFDVYFRKTFLFCEHLT